MKSEVKLGRGHYKGLQPHCCFFSAVSVARSCDPALDRHVSISLHTFRDNIPVSQTSIRSLLGDVMIVTDELAQLARLRILSCYGITSCHRLPLCTKSHFRTLGSYATIRFPSFFFSFSFKSVLLLVEVVASGSWWPFAKACLGSDHRPRLQLTNDLKNNRPLDIYKRFSYFELLKLFFFLADLRLYYEVVFVNCFCCLVIFTNSNSWFCECFKQWWNFLFLLLCL